MTTPETTKVVPGLLVATPTPLDAARETATRMARALAAAVGTQGRASLALSGGGTPRDAYALLARAPDIDWAKVDIFWVDERAVPESHERSNYRLVRETLLESVQVPPANVHRMHADDADLAGAARTYASLLETRLPRDARGVPVLDVVLLGIGEDAHTASLFPGEPHVDIDDRWAAAVPSASGREARLTLTAPCIEAARALFVLVVGRAKHAALEKIWAVSGDVHETPARILRGARGSVTWIIDKAAGGLESE